MLRHSKVERNIVYNYFTVYNKSRPKQEMDFNRKALLNFLISSFRPVLYVVCFVLGNYPTSGFYMPTFQNTLSVPS